MVFLTQLQDVDVSLRHFLHYSFGKSFLLYLDSLWFTAKCLHEIKGPIKMKTTY